MSRLIFVAAAALLAALVHAVPAHAGGPQQRRLQIDAELLRDAGFTGVERGRARLVQNVSLQVVLTTDGTPMPGNPLDPEDGRRQLERAQRTQQKVQGALQRNGAAPAQPPSMSSVQALQAQAQALMARCGQDRDCLMREATAISAARVGAGQPQVQARLQAYGDAVRGCERQHAAGAAREACIAQARRQAGGDNEGDADEVVETPYLHFNGVGACQWDAAVRIEEHVQGSSGDVQGMVPFSVTTKADGRERDAVMCPMLQAVLDTRNGRLWTRVLPALRGVPGTSVRAEQGRKPRQSDAAQLPRWHEGEPWLAERLANLDAEGSDRLQRKLPDGTLDLRLRWKFVPL